jgi:hypothetical protein
MGKSLSLILLAGPLAMTAFAAEPTALAPMDKEPTLPFAIPMTETRIQPYPGYLWQEGARAAVLHGGAESLSAVLRDAPVDGHARQRRGTVRGV